MRFAMPNHPCDFEIPDDWVTEAGLVSFTPTARAYHSTVVAVLVPLVDIEPPFRTATVLKDWRGFDRSRIVGVLKGIAADSEIPPVPLRELPEPAEWYDHRPYRYRVRDGYHRFYASIIAGFECLPGTVT